MRVEQRRHRAWVPHRRHQRQRRDSEARPRRSVAFRSARRSRDATCSSARACAAPATISCGASCWCETRRPARAANDGTEADRCQARGLGGRGDRHDADRRRTGARREPGRPDSRDHADGIHGIPAGPRGFHARSKPPRTGWGPAFNGTSCAACHNVPAIGGASLVLETRAGIPGRRTALSMRSNASGDTLMHLFSVPQHTLPARDARRRERRGAARTDSRVRRRPRRGDPGRHAARARGSLRSRRRRRIAGAPAIVTDVATGERRVGRFGWKAQHATLLAFAGDAYRNEMGITNDLFPKEFAFGDDRGSDAALRSAAGSRRRARSR